MREVFLLLQQCYHIFMEENENTMGGEPDREEPFYKKARFLIVSGLALLTAIVLWYAFDLGIIVPPGFTGTRPVEIQKGASAPEIAELFYRAGIIRRSADFLLFLELTRSDTRIKPGLYSFNGPISVPGIVWTITSDAASRQITILEGWNNAEIAEYLEKEGVMSQAQFISAAAGQEGYLFPDTYKIFAHIAPQELVRTMRDTFDQKTNGLAAEAQKQKKPFGDFVIIASLIEKEAETPEDRAIISGILWKRLAGGLPLQVDATITYLTGKASKDLTEDDLRIDSPYNTYRYAGLPKGPIGNPGLDALHAAFFPKPSPYLFYLHDKNGQPHYAKTFEEHIANIAKYLR